MLLVTTGPCVLNLYFSSRFEGILSVHKVVAAAVVVQIHLQAPPQPNVERFVIMLFACLLAQISKVQSQFPKGSAGETHSIETKPHVRRFLCRQR